MCIITPNFSKVGETVVEIFHLTFLKWPPSTILDLQDAFRTRPITVPAIIIVQNLEVL